MATILLQAAGAYLGGFLGSVGGAIGSAAGAVAGYVVDRALINSTQHIEGPRLTSARPFTAEEGVSIARLYGTARIGGILVWATRFEESSATSRQGKLGPKVTEYSYFANVAFLLCEGEIAGIRRVWADGREIDREKIEMRVYRGSADQPADPLIEAKQGSGNTPAYRGVAYVVLERFDIGEFGNRVPQLQFEVIRPVGRLNGKIKAISLIPGAIEYGLSAELVSRERRPGDQEAVNRHVLFAGTDIAASLDELQMLCPSLQHVALVVSWFGDDLRAGHCRIEPAVTTADEQGLSSEWRVSATAREEAKVVSVHDGGGAFGGTPSDASVLSAIAELKARGLSVTLYPFILMDVAEGNAFPSPYGGSVQPSYPWRGRITADPAPMQPGSADKTAAARAQVSAFCGTAQPSQFEQANDTVAFIGAPGEWSYRRMILHYAHLAVKAGGVNAFLIGSELRGLTTLRDEHGAFPFVEQLCGLAADVRSIVGAQTRLTYGADWSEYFGHHPEDGSGDAYFHLDALWAHAAIDAVGIDNYMPLSDWRDNDHAGGNPDGFAGPYDPHGLTASIAGGEGFDWYYASSEARQGRVRSPITDGAYGKPWVYRYKDIANWWSNPHHDRIGAVEVATPTAWVAQGKPIWFTEVGCPATDKGPNQPNVFPDPKSVENASPYFSNGGRSDAAQQAFLQAHMDYWDQAQPDFEEARNPRSSVYDGRMVDATRIYPWSWDARPYPAFPLRGDLWSDSANFDRGHWLNGRLAYPSLAALINAILADHGQPPADTTDVEGTVEGYLVTDPTSARSAIEPLTDLFDIIVREEADALVFRQAGATPDPTFYLTELVADEDGPLIETVRLPDHQLPAEATLTFLTALTEYQSASVRGTRLGAAGSRQQNLSFPGVLEVGQGKALLDDWLDRVWYERETITFSVAQPRVDVEPGSIVRLPASGSSSDFLVVQVEDGLVRKVSARQVARGTPAPSRPSMLSGNAPAPILTGQPHALFLDLPAGIGADDPVTQFRAASWQKPWRSQSLFASPEDTGFAFRSSLGKAASLGRLASALEPGFTGRIDRQGEILVELFDAQATSISMLQLLNGANAAAIRSASGAWEIIQFSDAEEVSSQIWQLRGLLRGQLGTDDAMAEGAAVGSDFVMLDDAVRPAGLLDGEVGLALNWRVGPSGSSLSSADFLTRNETGGIRSLLPLSPVHLKAGRVGDDIKLSWIRRGRIDADKWESTEIPLGEEREEYQVDIAAPGGATVRTRIVSESEWTYPAADIATDFASPPAEIDVTVRQLSIRTGWGLPATRRLAVS
ncbi:MAG TPA: glycoside hydrolase/phage tail family protein [Mesorhizobium sp.]